MLQKGNSKLGKIVNFSLPPIKSCPNCKYCVQKDIGLECYAIKPYRQYKTVRDCWNNNHKQSKRKSFVKDICNELSKLEPKLVRIHVSGDFYSQTYLNKWFDICKSFPKTSFLAFTKSFKLNFTNKPENLKIIYSVMPRMTNDMIPQQGSRAYCGDMTYFKDFSGKLRKFKGILHSKGEQILNCHGYCENCGICWDLPEHCSVSFEIH